MNKKNRFYLPMFIWAKKAYTPKGQEVRNMDKVMYRYRIYEKVEERGDYICYKLKI